VPPALRRQFERRLRCIRRELFHGPLRLEVVVVVGISAAVLRGRPGYRDRVERQSGNNVVALDQIPVSGL
jgi:hypothetical protein